MMGYEGPSNIRIDFAPLWGAGPRCRTAGHAERYTAEIIT